jgi:hypothetical protein
MAEKREAETAVRASSTNGSAPAAPQPSNDKAARRKRFEDVFPVIAKELTDYLKGENMPEEAVEWYERVSGRGSRRLHGRGAESLELELQHPRRYVRVGLFRDRQR